MTEQGAARPPGRLVEVGTDSVQGRWRRTTEQGAFTGEGAFDLEFTAPLSAAWLSGEALPDGGGSRGAAVLADVQQREPDRAAGLTVTGGRADFGRLLRRADVPPAPGAM